MRTCFLQRDVCRCETVDVTFSFHADVCAVAFSRYLLNLSELIWFRLSWLIHCMIMPEEGSIAPLPRFDRQDGISGRFWLGSVTHNLFF